MKTSYSHKFLRSPSRTGGFTNTLYLTKIKPIPPLLSSNSKASTDDLTFGSSELNQIERINMKKTTQTQQIWYKAPNNNIYDTLANNNHTQIKRIKNRVRSESEQSNFDLRAEIEKKKYFSLDFITAIYESDQILKRFEVQKTKPKKTVDIYTFNKENKEICLKNNMIALLQSEMNKVSNKEKDIKTALSLSQKGLEKDIKLFEDLVIDHKHIEKDRRIKLNEATHYNKLLHEKKKQLTHILKGLQEDIGRHLNQIIQYKTYADFVHLTLNYKNEISNVTLGDIENTKRDKDLLPLVKKVVTQFSFLDQYEQYHPHILDDPDQLTVFFDQVDSNIRMAINEHITLINEMYHQRAKNEKLLSQIEEKESELKQDLINLSSYDSIKKDKLSIFPTRYNNEIKENTNYINILHNCLKELDRSNNNSLNINSTRILKNTNINDIIKECSNLIYKKEILVNNFQDELNKMQLEQPEQLKKIVDKVKQVNKKNKLIEMKEVARKQQEERKFKYLKRMAIYKPHGGIVYPPPQVLNIRKSIQSQNAVNQEIGYDDLNYD